jgi:pantoate--beta-alanine ligase
MNQEQAPPNVVRTIADLRRTVAQWRHSADRIALVPTMGALHAGHLSLVQLGYTLANRVIVSLFVNPTQFGPAEDLSRYPRNEAQDLASLASVGCDLLFAPAVAEIYPEGFSTSVQVASVSDGLCGAIRPGHFDGVATIVCKLLNQAQADVAIFGEKDFQQLQVIRRMVADLNIPTEIIGAPIIRDPDGLAMSSRNIYLSTEERAIAQSLPRLLQWAKTALEDGESVDVVCTDAKRNLLSAGFASVDYIELRSDSRLAPMAHLTEPARLLAAARVGKTRLIDNLAVAPK